VKRQGASVRWCGTCPSRRCPSRGSLQGFCTRALRAAALALFGLGTAPALLGVSVADELLARNRAVINRLSQVFLLAMGIWFLWTGFAGRS
jgi:hypothetical protein